MKKNSFFLSLVLLAVSCSCFAQNTPTVYTDEASFVAALGSNYFLDDFNDLTLGTQVDSLTRTSGDFVYSIKDKTSSLYSIQLYELNGSLSHSGYGGVFQLTNKGKDINAFGGYLYGTDASGAYNAEVNPDTVTVGTNVYTFTPASATSFIGFIFPEAISSFKFSSTYKTFSTIDHFYVGSSLTSSVSEVYAKASVKLYPNPVRDMLYVSTGEQALQSVVVCDFSGKVVISSRTASPINVSALPAGVYLVQIRTANGVVTRQMIKQ
ncbi:MAG: hypothetical protein H6Q14_1959 [Bacteroidetes bacterium]|jgi:hypothetical protein|nr:hypothetical protein [Bacteroidota bacterium]